MNVVIRLALFVKFGVTVIRLIGNGLKHRVFRVVRDTRPVTLFAIDKFFRAVFVYRQRLYVQSVFRKVETSIRYFITFAKVDVIIGLALFIELGIGIIGFV